MTPVSESGQWAQTSLRAPHNSVAGPVTGYRCPLVWPLTITWPSSSVKWQNAERSVAQFGGDSFVLCLWVIWGRKQVSPRCWWVLPLSPSHQECQEHSPHPIIPVLERGGRKLWSFLLVTISQHYTTQVLCSTRSPSGSIETILLTEKHYLWCQLPPGAKKKCHIWAESAARMLDTMTRYVLVPSCLNHVVIGRDERRVISNKYTGDCCCWTGRTTEMKKWWFMLTINCVEVRTRAPLINVMAGMSAIVGSDVNICNPGK